MPLDQSRREIFYRAWRQSWPELNIVMEPTFWNHPKLQGLGILAANLIGMSKALDHEEKFDYLIIFEDDVIPFANTTWPTDEQKYGQNDLDHMLDKIESS